MILLFCASGIKDVCVSVNYVLILLSTFLLPSENQKT